MIVIAGHLLAMRSGRARMPESRYRIRSVNGGLMLTAVPLLASAFSVVSPDEQKLFLLIWMSATGLMGIVFVLAVIDAFNNVRLGRIAEGRLRDEHRAVMLSLREGHDQDGGRDEG